MRVCTTKSGCYHAERGHACSSRHRGHRRDGRVVPHRVVAVQVANPVAANLRLAGHERRPTVHEGREAVRPQQRPGRLARPLARSEERRVGKECRL